MNILVRTYPCVLHHSIQHQFLYSSGIRSPNNRFGPAHKRLNPCAHVRPARSMSLLHWHHHKTASRPLERLWLRLVCLQAFHQTLSSQETAVLHQVLCTVSLYRSYRLLYYLHHYRSLQITHHFVPALGLADKGWPKDLADLASLDPVRVSEPLVATIAGEAG